MKLILARHGETASFESDPPLSKGGIETTQRVAQLFKSKLIKIDEILHSPKLRAKQTAEILAHAVAPHLFLSEMDGLKPNDDLDAILAEIRSYDRTLLIVSHLPFLERLAFELIPDEKALDWSPSTVACLERQEERWKLLWILSSIKF